MGQLARKNSTYARSRAHGWKQKGSHDERGEPRNPDAEAVIARDVVRRRNALLRVVKLDLNLGDDFDPVAAGILYAVVVLLHFFHEAREPAGEAAPAAEGGVERGLAQTEVDDARPWEETERERW